MTKVLVTLGVMPGTTSLQAGMGIDDLPDGLGVLPCGHPAAIVVEARKMVGGWCVNALLDALAKGPVFLLAENCHFVDELLEQPALRDAFNNGALSIVLTRPTIVDEIKRHGMQCVIQEMQDNGLTKDHTVYWIGDHEWLRTLQLEQLEKAGADMRGWTRKRIKPVVFVFMNPQDPMELGNTIGKMFDFFPSVALLSMDRNWPALLLQRWNGATGAVFDSNYGLNRHSESNRLGFNGCITRGSMQEILAAPDKDVVIVTQAAVGNQRNLPTNWKVLSQAGEGASAVAESVAATIVLHAGSISDFPSLTRVVHYLRVTHPRTLKIVVRENDAKLRVNIERALVHLGVNLIIYREVGFARLVQMIHDINDQTFSGEVDADYEKALSSYQPDVESGYAEPGIFCTTVLKTLERTQSSGMTHSLVQLHLLPVVPHLDALNACRVFRQGDLVTADSETLLVFLFACSQADIDAALGRLFTVPVTQLFSSQVCDSTTEGIKLILNRLSEAARRGLPNYGNEIRRVTGNVIPVAFHGQRGLMQTDEKPGLPRLNQQALISAEVSLSHAQPPTFRARVIRRQTELPMQQERVA